MGRVDSLLWSFLSEQEDAPLRLRVSPPLHAAVAWSPRQLDAFASRAQRVYEDARDVLGFDVEEVEALARLARNFALGKRGGSRSLKRGRKLDPATPLVWQLSRLLARTLAGKRWQLLGDLMREIFGIDLGSAEDIRLRVRAYQRRRPRP